MRVLGIDYGEKRTGLAISDEYGLIAKPMPILKVKSFADAVAKVQRIAKTQNVARIIVGLPLGPNREETQQSIKTRYFADSLKITNGKDIEFWNESFTTKEARKGSKTRKKKKAVDSEAARIILQEYLDNYNEEKNGGAVMAQEHLSVI